MRFILYVFLLTPFTATAQWNITGHVFDEAGTPVPSASVLLLHSADSSQVRATASDARGSFLIQNTPPGSWLIKVSFLGYRPAIVPVGEPSGDTVAMGKITLFPDSLVLNEVTIQGGHIPIVLKKDTIEYNARSFKTRNNAPVEDLLKKMPGIRVESDGTIIAQGEQVKRVTVDGKEFFGRDPKLATGNLPADAIDKVQVINRKSEQARFSGIDDGKGEKAINLVLKEDRKTGSFGNASAGMGSSGRREAKASINHFSEDNQLSFLGMANNTNQQGFSMDEYLLYSGIARQMAGGNRFRVQVSGNTNGVPLDIGTSNNGLITSYAGGLNVHRQAGKNTTVNGSYFFNLLDHTTERTITRENFQPNPENNFNSVETGTHENLNIRNRGNVTIDHALDSAHSIRFNGNFAHNTVRTAGQSNTTMQNVDGTLLNSSAQYHAADIEAFNWVSNLLYRHKFGKDGRTFSANMDMVLRQRESEGTLTANNRFYGPDTVENTIDQLHKQSGINRELGAVFSYTEPLGRRSFLEATYSIRQNRDKVDHAVYNGTDSLVFDASLSNIYSSEYLFHRGDINLQLNGNKYTLMAGMALQRSVLSGLLKMSRAEIHSSFSHLLPVARLSYRFSPQKRLKVDYETHVVAPTVEQLQPVTDNSNPLHIYTGNPNLNPEYRHNLRFSYHHFNPSKFVGFLAFMEVTYTENHITNAQRTDERFIRYSMPVNLKGAFAVKADANLTFPVRKINSNVTFGAKLTDQHSMHLLNGLENSFRQSAIGFNFRYNYSLKELVDLNFRAQVNHQLTRYEIDPPSQAFLHHAYAVETLVNFLTSYQISTGLEYLRYESSGFTREIPLLDLSVSRRMLKNNALELKLSAVNLLNTDTGITQDAGVSYLERQVTNSLGRYYMIGLTYTLNKQLNPLKEKRGGGIKILRQK